MFTITATDKMVIRKALEGYMSACITPATARGMISFTIKTKTKPVEVEAFWADELLQFVTPIAQANR